MPEVDLPACDYAVMVSRRESRPEAGYWPIQLRDPIPLIPFPLRRDEIIRIDLKIIIEQVYEAAHYQNEIYSDPITPPLSNDDAAWVSQILTSAGISVGE